MKVKFDNLSKSCSKITTTSYSTSFSLGIKFLDGIYREPMYAIYGFVKNLPRIPMKLLKAALVLIQF
jgi:phytoene synthase